MNIHKRNKRAKAKAKKARTVKAGDARKKAELRRLVTRLTIDMETGKPGEFMNGTPV